MSAVQSDVSLQSCLTWETERPYPGRPRRSSCFGLFGQEWYLQISLEDDNDLKCYVHLFRNDGAKSLTTPHDADYLTCNAHLFRSGGAISLETPVVVSCHIIAKDLVLRDLNGFNYKHTVLKSGDLVFYDYVPESYSPANHRSGTWTVFCRLSCAKPLTLHTENETIHLSTVSQPPVCLDRCVQTSPGIPWNTKSLAADMSTLLRDEYFSDFELKCRGRVFRVHKAVLAARSEVFRAMFRNPMRESESGSADIEDLEVPVLESLIKFVYAETLEPVLGEQTIFKMYQAADKYAVNSLKSACSYWMTRNIMHENCFRFLDVAESHCDRDLRTSVVSFILEHPEVLKTEAWLAFSKQRQELAIEIFQTFVSSIVL